MNIRFLLILAYTLIIPLTLLAQRNTVDYDVLLSQLEASARKGEKRSLRDLGSLLDKNSTKDRALNIIRKFSLFTQEEINLNKSISKSEFHHFYYNYEKEIQFSDILGVYLITPLEERKIKYEVQHLNNKNLNGISPLKAIKRRMEEAISDKNQGVVIQQIELLGDLYTDDASIYMYEVSQELRSSSKKWSNELYQSLCKGLAQSRDIDCLSEILRLLSEKNIDAKFAMPQLVKLTNIEFKKAEINSKNLIKTYQHYIDSLGTIEDMRAFGYAKLFNFQPRFFNHIVDYYGRILCFADGREWIIHNVTQDLIATRHPRSLFYLTALGYKNSFINKTPKRTMHQMVQRISQLTNLKVGVENVKRTVDFDLNKNSERTTLENYLIYWASSYNDYEWDEGHESYVNKYNALEKTQNYEKLFRRLNSRNDSVAMASFAQLTEGDPSEIVALAEKYRQMFRSYNKSLPPFKYKYLEQLSALTQYCKKHKISYKPDKHLLKLLNKLYNEKDEVARYKLENKVINSIKLENITAVEYWGCINQDNEVSNYSLGRILDVFYSKNWDKIMASDSEIQLYLKKSLLLANIGVIGVCNNYLNKFNIDDPKVITKLNEIKAIEIDRQILNQILLLVSSNNDEETGGALADFIENPASFNKRDIKILPPPNKTEFTQIVESIKTLNDNNAIKNLFYFLRLHPSIDQVPQLFELAQDTRVLHKKRGLELTIGDNVTPILENIYNFIFAEISKEKPLDIRPWNKKWKEDKNNYLKWADQFFTEKIIRLVSSPELSIDDINLITESPNYNESHKGACLVALSKVTPVKDIRRLSISPKLSLKDDLKHFEAFDFSHKVLDDIPKLFNLDDPSAMLNYLLDRSANYKTEHKGSLFNNLFRYPWFTTYIHSGKAKENEVLIVKKILEGYLNESDYLSEFEEQATTLHLAQLENIGKPLNERILASFQLNVDNSSKAKVQETIISTISYQQIGEVAQHFSQLSETLGEEPWAFLRKDFGLPIFDLNSDKAYRAFLNHHKELSEYDFYVHYLKEFGVDFLTKKNELDYQKIYEILQFDAVTPFVAGGGGKRDYYTFGIIKILELKFKTSLGFHEKLNENQSFYSFSTAKRSNAWINYLIEQKLIKTDVALAPSFNQVFE